MKEFILRRDTFLSKMQDNSIAIILSATEMQRNSDCDFPFRQNSGFIYLTGFNEPDAYLLLVKKQGMQQSILFNRKKDASAEIWHGSRVGQSLAVTEFGFDLAFENIEFEKKLISFMRGATSLYFPIFQSHALNKPLANAMGILRGEKRRGSVFPVAFFDCLEILKDMRLIKSNSEIKLMLKASEISAAGHVRAMKKCRPGMWEYQLEGEIRYEFTSQGSREVAYSSIVAGGKNACCLHYTKNDAQLKDGDLVLIDAGAEFKGYAGDVTRTFPVNGVFSEEQKLLYQLVLELQINAIAKVKVGVAQLDINKQVIKQLVDGLIVLGLLRGKAEELIEDEAYKAFYMHGIGHYIGLDVHDVGDYRSFDGFLPLAEGMVVTIEPGIYVGLDADVEDKWKGIGIRIEDDVLVTKDGPQVLSHGVPKTIKEIEVLMANV
ncbi:MAG: Xaa-Pro aminopeptidase [Psychromonas sp.]|nr:Xaa-Pro aminopeptidase [Psychromonas sp.]